MFCLCLYVVFQPVAAVHALFLFRFQLPDFIAQFHHFAHIFKVAVRQFLNLCLVIFLGLQTFLLLLFQIRNLASAPGTVPG